MVAKVRLGRSFGQTVRYLFEGRKTEQQKRVDKKAEILGSNGIRRGTIAQITADFQRQQSLNPDLNVVAWHAALSFSEDDQDRLSNDTMLRLALLYMTDMGIIYKKYRLLPKKMGRRFYTLKWFFENNKPYFWFSHYFSGSSFWE